MTSSQTSQVQPFGGGASLSSVEFFFFRFGALIPVKRFVLLGPLSSPQGEFDTVGGRRVHFGPAPRGFTECRGVVLRNDEDRLVRGREREMPRDRGKEVFNVQPGMQGTPTVPVPSIIFVLLCSVSLFY